MAKRSRAALLAAKESATEALSGAKREGTLLGALAWWDFTSGYRGASAMVRDEWSKAGLDPETDLVAPPDYETAFGRAVASSAATLRNAGDCRAEDCAKDPDGRRVAVLQIKRNGKADGSTVGLVFCPRTGAPRVEQADPYGHAEHIVDATRAFVDVYTTDDLRGAVVAVLDRWRAVPCREGRPHVVYWVPLSALDTIRKVRDALKAIGAGTIHLSLMHDDPILDPKGETRESATSAANAGLESRLAEFSEQVTAWATTPPGRTSTVEAMIDEAERLIATGNLYETILGGAVVSVRERVASVQAKARAVLGVIDAAKEAKRASA